MMKERDQVTNWKRRLSVTNFEFGKQLADVSNECSVVIRAKVKK